MLKFPFIRRAPRLLVVLAVVAAGLTVTGGQVARASSCGPSPSACGYSDWTNTGFTTSLTPVTGPVTISTSGSSCNSPFIYQNKDVDGTIYINANYVKILNVRATATSGTTPAVVVDVAPGKVCVGMDNSTIVGNSTPGQICVRGVGAGSSTIPFTDTDISGCTIGYNPTDLSQNQANHLYIHSLGSTDVNSAFRGIYEGGGVAGGAIRHNTIFMPGSAVDAVGIERSNTSGSGTVSDDNFILGGVYSLKLTATGTVSGTATVNASRLGTGSSGYMLRNRAITTTGTTIDDITGANINGSL